MKKRISERKVDIYTELCPASSMAIMGSGLITVTMGQFPIGAAIALAGLAVGVAGPLAKTYMERRVVAKR